MGITTLRVDDTADRILDAAEDRLRRVGFHGTSFRDLAGDVGIKSASVHYHFPTKADLGRAVVDRYTERFLDAVGDADDYERDGAAKLAAVIAVFKRAVHEQRLMCLCGLLATERDGLPLPVQEAVARFFEAGLDWLTRACGGGEAGRLQAVRTIALLEGALLVAHAMGDASLFDRATADLAPG